MRDAFLPRGGFQLLKTPTWRQRARRRRVVAVASVLGLLMVGGVAGALLSPAAENDVRTGPFSYFPYQ